MEIRLGSEAMRLIALFERVTQARVRDCLEEEDRLTFVVEADDIGRAVGRRGANLRRLRDLLRKDVEVVAWAPERERFLRNVFHRYKVERVSLEERRDGSTLARVKVDARDKARAIGRGGRNVQLARSLARRHFSVDEVVVD